MAKAKRQGKEKGLGGKIPGNNEPLDDQVISGDTITIADAKQFVADAKKKQSDYKAIADRSWNEIEKRNNLGELYGGKDLDRARRWVKFPLWWSCWKIRQPLAFARLAIPVLKDTQGDDPYGRTACILGERFTKSILKTFEAFSEFASSIDDFLVTNFGWGRWLYRSDECKEEEKIRLQVVEQPQEPQLDEAGQEIPQEPPPPIFLLPDGQPVDPNTVEIQEDDLGVYIKTGEIITVQDERVYFEHGPYCNLLIDPEVNKWNKVTRLAYEYPYSYREFGEKFGNEAREKLSRADIEEYRSGRKPILVYEYHDSVLKECRWFADCSEDFFQPIAMGDEIDNSPLYELTNFFPNTEPLVINQSTRSFWPTPEFFQVQDILDDVSSIVTRMIQLTKAIRVRFFFDSAVRELKTLIGENWAAGEGTGMGIPNLQQTLMNNKGSLAALVAYFPVDELIQGLQNMYTAYEQRLNMFYNITGFSDLIRGQTSDSDKTYGERQLEGKFALNRMEPYQRKIQEWLKDNYQLGMEMGLKMFSDQTIDEYITPQTLDLEDKKRYVPSLDLLKSNRRRRFRVDFETDSTISINQEWKKTQAIETANAITKMMESVAKTAADMPELADAELRIMKHVVAELTDGKLFMDEITDAIQQTIDKVNEPKEPEPNVEMEKLKLEGARLQFDQQRAIGEDRLEQMRLQMEQGLEGAKLAQKDRLDGLALQLEQFKLQVSAGQSTSELQLKAQQIQADVALAQEELAAKRAQFLLDAREIASKTEVAQLQLLLDKGIADQKQRLEELYVGLEQQKTLIEARDRHLAEQEKWLTEARLQEEHKINVMDGLVNVQKTLQEMKQSPTPVVVKLDQPKAKKKKRTGRIVRDAAGDATHIEIDELEAD